MAIPPAGGVGYLYVCLCIDIGKHLYVHIHTRLLTAPLCTSVGAGLCQPHIPALKQKKDAQGSELCCSESAFCPPAQANVFFHFLKSASYTEIIKGNAG